MGIRWFINNLVFEIRLAIELAHDLLLDASNQIPIQTRSQLHFA